jgi:hydrogenase/urease accessory protein HupE
LLVCAAAPPAAAHPLLQDAIRIDVARDHVTLQVTATREEILVAATAAGRGNVSLDERVRRHGEYILSRLTVDADGDLLHGTVTATPAPDSPPPYTYALSYAISDPLSRPRERVRQSADLASDDARVPRHLTLHNDVLREVGLSLGGPWEVSYLVTLTEDGRTAPAPLLLTAAAPLTISLDTAFATAPSGARLAWAYLRQGILHILRGYDHLLFVAALVLAAVTLRDLVKVVVAFTLAHATTLTLCALRWITLREAVVEPLIAASIVVVALQNLLAPSSSRRAPRLAIAFGFGLLHGCGFASGALQAMRDLPAAGLGLAVGAFSLGVELGHQVVVIPTFMLLNRLRERTTAAAMTAVQRAGSAAIAVAGAVYLWLALHH